MVATTNRYWAAKTSKHATGIANKIAAAKRGPSDH
jgi:hypothetical protein